METQKYPDDADWRGFRLSERTFSILDTMQKGTSDGSLRGAILIKEPVFIEPDRCYVEARNLLQFLHLVNWRLKWIGYVNWIIIFVFLPPHVKMLYIHVLHSILFLSHDIRNDNREFIIPFLYFLWVIFTSLLYVFYRLGYMWLQLFFEGTRMKYVYQLFRSFNFLIIFLMSVQLILVVSLTFFNFYVINAILNRKVCLGADVIEFRENISLVIPVSSIFVILVLTIHCLFCLTRSQFCIKQWRFETVLPDFL